MIRQFQLWVYTWNDWKQEFKHLDTNVHGNIIHNCWNVEAPQVSINGWMNKQNVVHLKCTTFEMWYILLLLCTYIHMKKYYSALKRKGILTQARAWTKLED